jgi:protein tyrosine phosphatase (PTP) superfamily phosphohydrolase (DUF442 family)
MEASRIEDIRNFRRVNEQLVTSGQPSEEQLAAAAASGVEAVINLALHSDPRYSLQDERGTVESLAMSYAHIPVAFDAPKEADLLAFFAAMEQCRGKSVLVHCAANYRVTAFLGLYWAVREGQSQDEAFRLMHTVWEPNETWKVFLEGMLESAAALNSQMAQRRFR